MHEKVSWELLSLTVNKIPLRVISHWQGWRLPAVLTTAHLNPSVGIIMRPEASAKTLTIILCLSALIIFSFTLSGQNKQPNQEITRCSPALHLLLFIQCLGGTEHFVWPFCLHRRCLQEDANFWICVICSSWTLRPEILSGAVARLAPHLTAAPKNETDLYVKMKVNKAVLRPQSPTECVNSDWQAAWQIYVQRLLCSPKHKAR